MPNRGKFIGSQDNLFVPDAPTIGTATAGNAQVSVAFTAPSDVGGDAVTLYGASAFLAGATVNYKVSVATGTLSTGGSGNVYFIDGIPTKQLTLIKGFTYVFDLSDSSNSGHPFAFKDSGGSSYTTGVTTSGTAGNASATVTLVLATDASEPSSYYCTSHGNGMGNTISLIAPSASTDPLSTAQAGATGLSSPVTITGLTNNTSYIVQVWAINDYGNGPLSSASNSFSPVPPPRALFAGAGIIDYVEVETTGNATDFGDLYAGSTDSSAGGSKTRALFGGIAVNNARIDTVEIFTTGNATDFGDLTVSRMKTSSTSNSTRCLWFMGQQDSNNDSGDWSNVIDYVTIASLGNATDFGDALGTMYEAGSGAASSTRGVVGGGQTTNDVSTVVNVLQYVTIASTGNATDFGDLTLARRGPAALSSSTRAVWGGGRDNGNNNSNIMDYITISSTGNATDFGDLATGGFAQNQGTGSTTRGIFAPALNISPHVQLDYITIASTGNSTTFGNLTSDNRYGTMATSSAHGGLA